jgi:protease PrsW
MIACICRSATCGLSLQAITAESRPGTGGVVKAQNLAIIRDVLIALAAAAIVPALMLMWFFHSMDVFREPPRVLWATFGLGILTIPFVLLIDWPITKFTGIGHLANPYVNGTAEAFFVAAIPEELCKLVALLIYAYRHMEFDEPMDGIVYGVAASLGFATLENVLYVTGGGAGVAVMRALTAVPGHACTGAVMGYFVGQAKFAKQGRGMLLLGGLFFPVLLHGLYDAPLLILKSFSEQKLEPPVGILLGFILFWLVALSVEIIWALRLGSRLRQLQLKQMMDRARAAVAQPAMAAAPAYMPGAPPAQVYAPPQTAQPSRVKGVLLLIIGTIFGGLGGLMTLGMVVVLVAAKREETLGVVIAALIIGVLPLALGILAFAFGIKALNRNAQPYAPAYLQPYPARA